MAAYKDKWNKKKYDQVNIRFPKGVVNRFRILFPDHSFNGWVVSLVCSRLMYQEMYSVKALPAPTEPEKD